jgi:hypothetical protein
MRVSELPANSRPFAFLILDQNCVLSLSLVVCVCVCVYRVVWCGVLCVV